jgi:uncharacterized protein (DUF2384 family)
VSQSISQDRAQRPATARYTDAEKARAGLTTFFSIAKEWGLSNDQQRVLLGSPGRTTFFDWKRHHSGNLSRDTLDRLSYLLGIYKALHILFSDDAAAQWLRHPNADPLFEENSPLQYMLSGQLVALADVRRYLDWARG